MAAIKEAIWASALNTERISLPALIEFIRSSDGADATLHRVLRALEYVPRVRMTKRYIRADQTEQTVWWSPSSNAGGHYEVSLRFVPASDGLIGRMCSCPDWQDDQNARGLVRPIYSCKHIMACIFSVGNPYRPTLIEVSAEGLGKIKSGEKTEHVFPWTILPMRRPRSLWFAAKGDAGSVFAVTLVASTPVDKDATKLIWKL